MRQNALLLTTQENWWRLYATETAMREAEYAVLGGYDQHRSELDWFPFDEDDERPDVCDRYIEWRPEDGSDRFVAAMKVAGYLGARCWLRVVASTPAWSATVRSDARAFESAYLHVDRITAEVQSRIRNAVFILQGIDATQPRDNPDQD